ncbi:VanZ family protein [Paenibacillus rhizovicinus]|uniref:VanZ family protein n=1 Tax=Paenibacillus rhizovicinus TaxID=2704463 RepID=A0A6C0NXQ7_9BACL|nr:VanZ family protein [Paenibacillus rhizovicinus]QHW30997.1 VanZ family protein [Paenibacillus rhizovicinus]
MFQHRRFNYFIISILLALYLFAVIKIIVFKFGSMDVSYLYRQLMQTLHHTDYLREKIHSGNLKPFHEIHRALRVRSLYELICLLGNVAIFMPLGSFVGLLSGKGGWPIFRTLLASFVFSLMLESAEAVFEIGIFDVDDLLLNTAGGLLGVIVFRLYAAFWDASHAGSPSKPNMAPTQAQAGHTTAILSGKG